MSIPNYSAISASADDENLLPRTPVDSSSQTATSAWKNIFVGVLVVALSASGVILYAAKPMSSTVMSNTKFGSSSITTTVTNEYTKLNQAKFAYSFLQDAVLMEPWRDNNVAITGISSVCSNTWKLVGKNSLSSEIFSGDIDSDNSFVAVPQKTGFYTLYIYSDCGSSSHEYKQSVAVKYVRRDVQTLTHDDREEFLDALRTLWDVSTEEGIKKYGPNYKSLYYFAAIHNDAGGNPICEELHNNAGFLHNHVYLGAFLEQSLQLVNPRVALHYWEYARDFSSDAFLQNHMANLLDGGTWTEIMTAKYFGKSDPVSGMIVDGRWAYTEMPRVTTKFLEKHGIPVNETFFPHEQTEWLKYAPAHIASPYGFMRSPWHYSNSKYTLRFNNVMQIKSSEDLTVSTFRQYAGSTCSEYKKFIKTYVIGYPLTSYLLQSNAQVHGHMHYTTAGAGGDYALSIDAKLRSEYGFTDDDIAYLAISTVGFMKTWLNRGSTPLPDGSLPIPVYCDAAPWDPVTETLSTNAEPGKGGPLCYVNDYYLTTEELADSLVDGFFLWTNGELHVRDVVYAGLTFKQKKEVIKLIVSRMQMDGDMAGPGSATDPIFWMAHGSVERLFQRALFEGALSDKVYSVVEGSSGSTCQGHAPDLPAYFLKGFYFEDKSVIAHEVTNAELAAIIDPTGDLYATYIPFVYDTSAFDYCDDFDQWWADEADDDRWHLSGEMVPFPQVAKDEMPEHMFGLGRQ